MANLPTAALPPVDLPWIADLIGPGVAVAGAAPDVGVLRFLTVDERRHVAQAALKRQADFGTARRCARYALRALGVDAGSLLPNEDRSPRWPEEVVGSLTHTEGCCLAAVAFSRDYQSLGIDIEGAEALDSDLEQIICTPAECRWLESQPAAERGRLGKLVFSAKEAVFKCQYPVTNGWLGFLDVELEVDPAASSFWVTRIAHRDGVSWKPGRRLRGGFVWRDRYVLAYAVLGARTAA